LSDPVHVTPTLLIVDDHAGFRRFAQDLFGAEGFNVVAVAADGESALDAAREHAPNVVLLDVQLPGIDGFEVARRLRESDDPPAVVLTSTRDAADYGSRLADAPIVGFVPKQELSGAALNALLLGIT
jgi:two-component system, NarL family, nitrate/nitrite response regulator NarL